MTNRTITLTTGAEVDLRDLEGMEYVDAQEESRVLAADPDGNVWAVVSPTLMSVNLLRRQIVRFGHTVAPISYKELMQLFADTSVPDFKQIAAAACLVRKTIH